MRSSADRRGAGLRAGAPATLMVAAAGLLAACGTGLGPERTGDPSACPEAVIDPMPAGHDEVARRLAASNGERRPVRVDLTGPGARILTIVSGGAGELAGVDLGAIRVAGRDGLLILTPAETLAILWEIADGPPGCTGYAIVADGYGRDEVEALARSVRILP